jgi:hypothetical protein
VAPEGPEAPHDSWVEQITDGESEVGFLDGASAQIATGCNIYQVHVGTCTWGGEESVRERDLDIVPTYTTCNAPQYLCLSPCSLSGEYVLDSFWLSGIGGGRLKSSSSEQCSL